MSRWQQRVDVLGPVIVRGAGGIVPLTRSMEIAVLSLLALRAGSPVSGDSLIDLLWPDDPPRTAGKTLQGYVKRVRSMVAVNGIDLSHAGPAGYVLALEPDGVDALQFEALVAHARTSTDDALRVRRLDEALALWRGEPFSGCDFEGLRPRREWLQRLMSGTRVERVAAQVRLGVSTEALGTIRALLVEEPTNERLWLHLASAHYLSGNPVAALDTITEARRSLDELVGVAPGPELTELQRRMLDHDDVEASYYRLSGASQPPVRLGAPRRSSAVLPSLPLPGGNLVGREPAIDEIVAAVDRGLPVITISGPGGMGKTRCAVEAARQASTPCRGFVDLSALSTGAGLALHLAGTFGVPDRDDPVSAVAAQLTGPRTTVVLDNVEQIVDAAQVIGELAQRCPSVVWLVTSQTELGLGVERVVRLRPLGVDERRSNPTAGRSAAVTLLAEAAERRGVRGIGEGPLEEIATLIGGIPLALELAACQLQYLEPAALLRSLHDPIEALVDPRRAIGRHRSMRACLELAGARLSGDARDLFATLSRRPAGAPYEDLLACWDRSTPLPRCVAELVEAGFASTSSDSAGTTRLTQLPLVRSYGRTMTRPPGAEATEAALDLAVFGRVQTLFAGAQPISVEPDLPDIRRLLQRGLDQPEAIDSALQLAAALIVYWWSVRITEGRRWLDLLLTSSATGPSAMRPYAAQTAAFLDFYVGDAETARRRLDEALRADLADPSARSRLLALLAMLDAADGSTDVAVARVDQALELARASGDLQTLFYALGNAGDVATTAGDVETARDRYVECIERLQRIGMDWLSAAPHARLGDLALSAGDHRRARMWFDRSIALWSARDLGPGAPQTLAGIARLDLVEGDLEGARRNLDTALATAERCGSRGEYPWVVLGYGGLMAACDRPEESLILFGLGLRHGPRAGHHVRRLVDAELAPFFGTAVDDARAMTSHPVVMATALEDLPAVVAKIVAE
ncbi:MAG TPA: BTAD domain-containing putative transcriptional regulator [Microlunatus sp.]|nr:BTAD domain-containing putative transcriptional regulator [Microlunatus sp.]